MKEDSLCPIFVFINKQGKGRHRVGKDRHFLYVRAKKSNSVKVATYKCYGIHKKVKMEHLTEIKKYIKIFNP